MIKASAVLERINQLGQEHPEGERPCRYVFDDGQGCCIVGTALIGAGMDPAPFLDDEDLNNYTDVRELFRHHAKELGLVNDLSEDDFLKLRNAQLWQDQGATWGGATEHLR